MRNHSQEPFFGRGRELAMLRKQAARPRGAFVPVYGRRRVGKTALLREFAKDRRALFFVGKQAPADLQKRELLQQAARTLDEPLLAQMALPDWKTLLLEILKRWPEGERVLLILDEFQWMAAASPELPSVLQELWDREWQNDDRLMLVLCGSYIGFMEREVLGSKSPLFGRRTGQIRLAPFSFADTRAFHPGFSLVDAARCYFICGGIPAYLKTFDDDHSIEQNIRDAILDEFAPLFREADFLLREELREVQSYHALLQNLATGSSPAADLAKRSGIANGSLTYYLSQLEALGYVDKRFPLGEKPPAKRHVRYRLADPLLRFWFRFVFPNLSGLSANGPEKTLRYLIEPQLAAYCGQRFEELCREALPALYVSEGVTAGFEVGEYWSKDVQIDVVGRRTDNVVDLGECRWGAIRAVATARELASKAERYPNSAEATVVRRIFARSRPSRCPKGVRWHSLRELYDAQHSL